MITIPKRLVVFPCGMKYALNNIYTKIAKDLQSKDMNWDSVEFLQARYLKWDIVKRGDGVMVW